MAIAAYTIFFCGTGSNSKDHEHKNYHEGELVSTLAKNMMTPEYQDWIIVDGPGSGNNQEEQKWVKPGWHYQKSGEILGWGWDNNVEHALAVLKKDRTYIDTVENNAVLLENFRKRLTGPNIPAQVNLVGWSRGGVTCHMMANAMLKDPLLSNIPVNIFAIDPVPGLGNFNGERLELGTNVRQYHAIYAKNERSIGFTPIIPTFSAGCVSRILPMPGRHATVVGNANETGGGAQPNQREYPQPGRMVRHLVEEKLTQWGTGLNNRLELTEDQMLELYDDMLRYEDDFQRMGRNKSYVYFTNMLSNTRTVGEGKNWSNTYWDDIIFFKALTTSGINGPVFVNEHHKNLFINQRVFFRKRPEDETRYPTTFEMFNQLIEAV